MVRLQNIALREAVDEIYNNTKIMLVGLWSVIFVLSIFLFHRVELQALVIFLVIQQSVIFYRIYLFKQYKNNLLNIDTDILSLQWLNRYRLSIFVSSLAWCVTILLFHSSSFEVNFIVFVTIFGIGASATLTLGMIFSVYILYLLPMFSIAIFSLLFFHHTGIYYTMAIFFVILSIYLIFSAKRYSKSFRDAIIEREKAILYAQKLQEQKDILYKKTYYDSLTKLPNRFLFLETLKRKIAEGKHTKPFALMTVNMDRIKHINDSLGYEIGDGLLIEITHRLKSLIGDNDLLARFGGDEFAIIFDNMTTKKNVKHLAEKILDLFKEQISIEKNIIYITCCIGISCYPKDSMDILNLLRYSDAALNIAKEEGKNKIHFYSPEITSRAYERLVLSVNLRKAIEEEEFVIYYQPQINARTGKFIGMEALIRWEDPKRGLVYPDSFIPLAEETGLIVEMDRIIMKKAMMQYSKWYEDGYDPGVLALNLSIKQLERGKCIDALNRLLKENKFKKEWLELEITEGAVMSNPDDVIKRLQQIYDLGIKIAVDDFGTGYSSLSYLKKFPVTKLKIDKSFIDGIPSNSEDCAIVKTIISFAKDLNLELLAEGVETQEQKTFLLDNGCENIQGYIYSKPISADEMERLFLMKTPKRG